jgi:hypothetical protein
MAQRGLVNRECRRVAKKHSYEATVPVIAFPHLDQILSEQPKRAGERNETWTCERPHPGNAIEGRAPLILKTIHQVAIPISILSVSRPKLSLQSVELSAISDR